MYRLTNYAFGFAVVYLFILEAKMSDHNLILLALVLSAVIAFTAFLWNWITLDAIKSVIILGTIVLGFSGWYSAFALVFFFLSGSLLLRRNLVCRELMNQNAVTLSRIHLRRDGYQVWANGFWLAVFTFGWFLTGSQAFLIAVFTAIAAATADTWATEIGTCKPGKTINIITLRNAAPGEDGAISIKGSLAAAMGATAISIFFWAGSSTIPAYMAFLIVLFGLMGCFLDSLLGAFYKIKDLRLTVPKDFSGGGKAGFVNSFINWVSTGTSGILALLITHFLLS